MRVVPTIWRRWLSIESRCAVPFTSFGEHEAYRRHPTGLFLGKCGSSSRTRTFVRSLTRTLVMAPMIMAQTQRAWGWTTACRLLCSRRRWVAEVEAGPVRHRGRATNSQAATALWSDELAHCRAHQHRFGLCQSHTRVRPDQAGLDPWPQRCGWLVRHRVVRASLRCRGMGGADPHRRPRREPLVGRDANRVGR